MADERLVQSVGGLLVAERLLVDKVQGKPITRHKGVKQDQVGEDLGPPEGSSAQKFASFLQLVEKGEARCFWFSSD